MIKNTRQKKRYLFPSMKFVTNRYECSTPFNIYDIANTLHLLYMAMESFIYKIHGWRDVKKYLLNYVIC